MKLNSSRLLAIVIGLVFVAGAGLVPTDADARRHARASVHKPAKARHSRPRPPAGKPRAGRPAAGRPPAGRPPGGRPPAGRPPAGRPPVAGRPPPRPPIRHPVGTAVAVGAAAAVTAAAVGSIVYSLPSSCTSVRIGDVTYRQCGSTWYQPQYYGSDVEYIVVESPR